MDVVVSLSVLVRLYVVQVKGTNDSLLGIDQLFHLGLETILVLLLPVDQRQVSLVHHLEQTCFAGRPLVLFQRHRLG